MLPNKLSLKHGQILTKTDNEEPETHVFAI